MTVREIRADKLEHGMKLALPFGKSAIVHNPVAGRFSVRFRTETGQPVKLRLDEPVLIDVPDDEPQAIFVDLTIRVKVTPVNGGPNITKDALGVEIANILHNESSEGLFQVDNSAYEIDSIQLVKVL